MDMRTIILVVKCDLDNFIASSEEQEQSKNKQGHSVHKEAGD